MTRAGGGTVPKTNWSPLEHVPSDEVLQRLLDTAERRRSAERFEYDHSVRTINEWLWPLDGEPDHNDAGNATWLIEAANTLAYQLGRLRPVVLIPHDARPTSSMCAPIEFPGGIMGIGRVPVREAIQAGARTVDGCSQLAEHRGVLSLSATELVTGEVVSQGGL